LFVYSKLKAGSCWHPPSSTRYWVMAVLFPPVSPLFIYLYTHVFPCSLCNSFMHVLGCDDHAFYIYTFPVLPCNSVFCICYIFSDFLWYLYYHFCHMVCLSYIWLCRIKYPCIVFLKVNVLNSTFRRTRNRGCLSLDSNMDQIKFWMREKFT
jgi:hypothetical protein